MRRRYSVEGNYMGPVTVRKVRKAVRGDRASTLLSYPTRPNRITPVPQPPKALVPPHCGLGFDVLWLVAWFAFSSIWCLAAAQQLGATYDEPIYVRFGLEHWRTGSCHQADELRHHASAG